MRDEKGFPNSIKPLHELNSFTKKKLPIAEKPIVGYPFDMNKICKP
jgi:hypothetical protein